MCTRFQVQKSGLTEQSSLMMPPMEDVLAQLREGDGV
jgi:hypothetical protein